jgi:adenylosuccinate synthase
MINIHGDIAVGLMWGDEGKGKVVRSLILAAEEQKDKTTYTHCVRFNGGPNAGHTIYDKGHKIATHQVPSGFIQPNMRLMIGPACVVDLDKLDKEITELEELGYFIRERLVVSQRAHIILEKHITEDISDDRIGSTKSGIRPVNRDKYNRRGVQAKSYVAEGKWTWNILVGDVVSELAQDGIAVLFEGAQGTMLDIDLGEYPYVTSSNCLSSGVTTCGFSFRQIVHVYGICKAYDTYVGNMDFQPDDPKLEELGTVGQEFGATTGRRRQCNWLNLDKLLISLRANSVSDLIVNKCDILDQVGTYKATHKGELVSWSNMDAMKQYITDTVQAVVPGITVTFSGSPHTI